MSTHASAFSKVFGDPATDISRRLAAANRAADEAEILTLEARQQQLAAEAETQAARAAAASACRRLELAEEDVRQANRVASDARHERRLALRLRAPMGPGDADVQRKNVAHRDLVPPLHGNRTGGCRADQPFFQATGRWPFQYAASRNGRRHAGR